MDLPTDALVHWCTDAGSALVIVDAPSVIRLCPTSYPSDTLPLARWPLVARVAMDLPIDAGAALLLALDVPSVVRIWHTTYSSDTLSTILAGGFGAELTL